MLMDPRQCSHLAPGMLPSEERQCLHPSPADNKRGGLHSGCVFTSAMPADCLPSRAKSLSCSKSGQVDLHHLFSEQCVSALWFVCCKDTARSCQCVLAPEICPCQGEGFKRRRVDGCQPCHSAAVVRKQWPLAHGNKEEWRCGKMGSERRFGPELLSVGPIVWP